jgi:glycerol-1-phosphate dehydrogenase [NAD(P)+]
MHYFSETTNITNLRIGRGSAKGIGKELGRFVVATMDIPWKVTAHRLGKEPQAIIYVDSVEENWIDAQIAQLEDFDTVVGIGGGMAIDMAKYISWKCKKRLVSIPTILSVDAFTTPAAGIRRNHEVFYVGSASPNPLVIDYDLLRTAPPELNIAGAGDLLSIHTACFDWQHAHSKGQSEYPFDSQAIEQGQALLNFIYDHVGAIRQNSDHGLRAIVEGYISLNTICLPRDHFRIEEGSEHYLFYELEERLQRSFIHGHIIGLGIYLMSRLQKNKAEMITQIMNEIGLKFHPKAMGIQRSDLEKSLLNLKHYVSTRPQLWYTSINDSSIELDWVKEHTVELQF